MGRVVVFANQKGGVSKTTTTASLGSYVAMTGRKVLTIDFDPQSNLTSALGVRNPTNTIYEALSGQADVHEAIYKTPVENLFVLPASSNLSGATVELVGVDDQNFFLRKLVLSVKDEFDYIFIDCPPSLGVLTMNGLVASEYVIIPLQCEFFALEGLIKMLFETVRSIQQTINPDLKIGGILFTMFDSRTNLSTEVVTEVKRYFASHPEVLFETVIPRNVKLAEAPSHNVPISIYDPSSTGARSYKELAEEFLRRVEEK